MAESNRVVKELEVKSEYIFKNKAKPNKKLYSNNCIWEFSSCFL